MKTPATTRLDGTVTLSDIAQKCGVSMMTVSNALRGNNSRVGDATRKRVLEVAREMGYDPSRNHAARRMALQKTGTPVRNHTVCVALPQGFGIATYYSRILEGMSEVMGQHGYGLHLVVFPVGLGYRIPTVFTKGDTDGLLAALPASWFSGWVKVLRNEPNFGSRPIVTLIDPSPGCSCVHADDGKAGYSAASHLLDLGHRYVLHDFQPGLDVMVGTVIRDDNVQNRRLQGMQQAYRDRGLDPDEFLTPVLMPHTDKEVDERGPGLLQALKDRPQYTAICAQNDFSAARVWQVLVNAGIRVPKDMSLVGFDDTDPVPSATSRNILTTVRMPLLEFGQESAGLILRAIEGQMMNPQNIVLPTELIVRQSTAPPKSLL